MADPFKSHDTKENPTAFAQGKDPRFPPAKETLTVPQGGVLASQQASAAFEQQKAAHVEPAPPPMPTPEQVKARIDAEAAQARNKARAEASTASERRVSVKLLNDVWIEDPTHEDAGVDGIRRVKTNIPVLNGDGIPTVDAQSKAPITTLAVVDLPLSVAKMLIDAKKAERMDPL